MAKSSSHADDTIWQQFVIAHGYRAQSYHLAAVVKQSVEDVERFRQNRPCIRLKKCKGFAELFILWHGRQPHDDEWPAPEKSYGMGYEWHGPELTLLDSLVGQFGNEDIAKILTKRLRKITRDPSAERTLISIRLRVAIIGAQHKKDALAREGYTIKEAAAKVGRSVRWVLARKLDGTIKVSQGQWDRRRIFITEPMLQRLLEVANDSYTIVEAAAKVGKSVIWVKARMKDCTIVNVSRAEWNAHHFCITKPMLQRLTDAAKDSSPRLRQQLNTDWLFLKNAALEAGVTTEIILEWVGNNQINRRPTQNGFRYRRDDVRACARQYWKTVHSQQAEKPDWLRDELEARS
jgi:hypothetical protein